MKSQKTVGPIENKYSLTVESLKPIHLSMLAIGKKTKRLGWMQIMLIRNFLAQAEQKLQGLIPTRQPKCLIALENDELIAIMVLQPNNRNGTSWSISLPELIKEPMHSTKHDVLEILLKYALNIENNVAQSWLIRCPNNNSQQLSISRKLGFQPLKILKRWTFNSKLLQSEDLSSKNIGEGLKWEYLSRDNASLLLRLKKASESAYLRELTDCQWIDLLDRNEPPNKVLISTEGNHKTALFGMVTPLGSEDLLSLELIRDVAWDARLSQIIPILLLQITNKQPHIYLETSESDVQLNKLLRDNGWEEENEKILLGKSLLNRRINYKLISDESSFEKIFERLQPSQPPLPTPFSKT